MQMYYYHNVEGKKDYIQWMGSKTWISAGVVRYDINDMGSGEVTMTCKVRQPTSNGWEPNALSSNKLEVTYNLSRYLTTAISQDAKLYMKGGMHPIFNGVELRRAAEGSGTPLRDQERR
jgi:hypothetical protein